MNIFDVYPLFDINLTDAKGSYVYDNKGNKYLDFYGGHAVISVGHKHPHYIDKINQQLNKIAFYSNSVQNRLQIELADKLGELSGCPDYQLFLCNSGAEANENALKIASFKTEKTKTISLKKGFHGRTSAVVSITDNPRIIAPINKKKDAFFVEINDTNTLIQLFDEQVCAFIVECIQGIGGIQETHNEFIQTAYQLCKKHQAIFIADEVQSGYGRTGDFFAFQKHSIRPDIISIAKGMGNGFPIGGVLIHPSFKPWHGMLGTTFGGNHLACAAGIAVLDIIEKEQLIKKSKHLGDYFIKQIKQIKKIKQVRGRGLMIGIEFDFPIAPIRKKLIKEFKIFTGASSNKNTLRLLPPLTVSKQEIDLFIDALNNAV